MGIKPDEALHSANTTTLTESSPALLRKEVALEPAVASTSTLPENSSLKPTGARIKRTGPQLLDNELLAEELVTGAPSRNGGRLLTEDRDPWTHNAWDKVEWGEKQESLAQEAISKQMSCPVPEDLKGKYNARPATYWDEFYAKVQDGFFNDRAWLRTEFQELANAVKPDAGPQTVVEIGCGPGNTLFPLVLANENPHFHIHGYDYSQEAIELVKANPAFDPAHCSTGVWDLASPLGLPSGLKEGSADIVTLIFCMSALHPDEWSRATDNINRMLKPGGVLLFRDYGRFDMAQLRFKGGRLLQDNLYIRGDGTRVYFFERDELVDLFGGLPASSCDSVAMDAMTTKLTVLSHDGSPPSTTNGTAKTIADDIPVSSIPEIVSVHSLPAPTSKGTSGQKLSLVQLGVDRRLLLNRKKKLQMYRVWLQGRWRKPLLA